MSKKNMNSLTLQFVSYSEIQNLDSTERIKKLLKVVLNNKIVLLQGRLRLEEETRLIEDTMALVGTIKGFKGIELAVFAPKSSSGPFEGVRRGIAKMLIGDTDSITIIGPASIVRDMKKDPTKLQLLLNKK